MRTHTVQRGDTLSGIAKKLGVDWRQITGYRSGNPNLIYVGEVLQIPDVTTKTATQTRAQTTQPAQATQQKTTTGTTARQTSAQQTRTFTAPANVYRVPSPSDINPQTGRAYAINPATGVWDDNYFSNIVVPAFQKQMTDMGMTREEIALLERNSPANIRFSDFEEQAKRELEPYYRRLLEESNYDLNLAKARLEEDYQRGLRVAREDSDRDIEEQLRRIIPDEYMTLIAI